jgi:16S rRNA processing protein RimM
VDGAEMGVVTEVVHVGVANYLVVRIDDRDRLVPFVAAIVPSVDPGAGRLVIDPPEGLFEL